MRAALEASWYQPSGLTPFLRPLSWLYRGAVAARRAAYRTRVLRRYCPGVPVIIIGNITVGGTGKTPLVIWLAKFLKHHGYRPGIVSRGYRGGARQWPQQVRADSDPAMVGDEPVVIARRTGCPMAVGPSRSAAAAALLAHHPEVDVLISDDGLQHYALERDIEIVVIDGIRRFGNRLLLPAGPLREPIRRLERADFRVVNGGTALRREFPLRMDPVEWRSVHDEAEVRPLEALASGRVHAVAGIGHPDRFFRQLRQLGLDVIEHRFPDHHGYQASDVSFRDELPVIMTEKDAVKCRRLDIDNAWYLRIEAVPHERLGDRVLGALRAAYRERAAPDASPQ